MNHKHPVFLSIIVFLATRKRHLFTERLHTDVHWRWVENKGQKALLKYAKESECKIYLFSLLLVNLTAPTPSRSHRLCFYSW